MKIINILILGIGVGVLPVSGQDFNQIAPKVPTKEGTPAPSSQQTGSQLPQSREGTPSEPETKAKKGKSNPQLLSQLKGVIFVASPDQVQQKGVSGVSGVKVDNSLPVLQTDSFQDLVGRYLGRPLAMNDLNQLVHDVIVYYRKHDRPIVDVSVPEQDVTGGVIQIVSIEGRLGKVKVEGNRWFSSMDLAGEIRLRPADPISGETVSEDAAWLNANPFRQVDLVYAPGERAGTTDIVLKTQDRFPVRVYTGYENSGNQFTGYNRWLAGFNWGNAFGLDQQLNYQFTVNNEYDLYNAHSGSWIIPLPWRHTLTFFGSYAQSQPDTNNALFTQNGYSWQVSGRYTIPLPSTDDFSEEFVFGGDFKRSNSNLFFGGAAVFNTVTDVDQFMVGYNNSLSDPYGSTSLNASFFYSPGGLTDNNHDSNFSATQAGAKANYYYALFQLNRITKLPFDFSLSNKVLGQVASDTLIGSEQFGIGGYSTVRGYDERIINGKGGIMVSNELRSPPLSPGQFFGMAGATDQLQFLAFVDYGSVTENAAPPGSGNSGLLLGVGPGIRYVVNPYFSVRADYGFQLKDANVPGITSNSRGEVGAILSY